MVFHPQSLLLKYYPVKDLLMLPLGHYYFNILTLFQDRSMKYFRKFIQFFKNKYVLTGVSFLLWILFFDHNNFFRYLDYRNELDDIKQKKTYYQDQIQKTRKDVELIKTNPLWLEKIAREQYLMKRNGEDIYISNEEK